MLQGDGDAEPREPVGEIRGPVERIDDPAEAGPGDLSEPFLSEEIMAGKAGRQPLMDGKAWEAVVSVSVTRSISP